MFATDTVHVRYPVADAQDEQGNPVVSFTDPEPVSGVLVAPAAGEDVTSNIRDGVRIMYTVFFRKGFGRDLTGALIDVGSDKKLKVVGSPRPFPEANVPGDWSMQVRVGVVDG